MTEQQSGQDYLAERGRLIGAIGEVEGQIVAIAEEIKWAWRHGDSQDDLKLQRGTLWGTRSALQTELAALDRAWHEADALERAADEEAALPARKELVARLEAGLAERARILREIENCFAPIKGLVADFEDMSESLRALLKPHSATLGSYMQSACQTLIDRRQEQQLMSGMLFSTGLWGAGTKDDYFRLQDRDLAAYERMMANSILHAVRDALLANHDAGR